jgi:hypothetical protein
VLSTSLISAINYLHMPALSLLAPLWIPGLLFQSISMADYNIQSPNPVRSQSTRGREGISGRP